jgi:hypothetical protein
MEQRLPATKRIVVFAGARHREYLMDYLRGRGAWVDNRFRVCASVTSLPGLRSIGVSSRL